nr:hypothetical protein [Herbaspirillum sp. B39]
MSLPPGAHVVYIGESPEPFHPEASLPANPMAGSSSANEAQAWTNLARHYQICAAFWAETITHAQLEYCARLAVGDAPEEDIRRWLPPGFLAEQEAVA